MLAGCSLELMEPNNKTPKGYLYAQDNQAKVDSIPTQWWLIFRDSTLNTLVERAIVGNKDLEVAIENIAIARSNIATARAAYLPSVEIAGIASRSNTPDEGSAYELSLTPQISWEVSLFGALKNSSRAARAKALSSEWGVRATTLALSCEVAKAYFTLLEMHRNLAIAQHSYTLRQEATALIDSMTRYGMGDGVALEQARALSEEARSDIYNYSRALAQCRLNIALLLGDEPQGTSSLINCKELDYNIHTLNIPAGLPSDLLERRPDILQARYTMLAYAAKVGVARAERFPTIELTALGGIISEQIDGSTSSKNFEWEISASLSQPVFKWYSLRNNERVARSHYMQSAIEYRDQILTALSEVESALVSISTLNEQITSAREVLRSNTKIAHLTESLYDNGLYNYLNVVDARRELYSSQIEFNELITERYTNYIELIKALGGGW